MRGVLCGVQFCAVTVSGGTRGTQNYLFYIVNNLADLISGSGSHDQVAAIALRSNEHMLS